MSDDIQQDIDDAAEHQQMQEQAPRLKANDPDVRFWAGVHDEVAARQRLENHQIATLDWALRRIFHEG